MSEVQSSENPVNSNMDLLNYIKDNEKKDIMRALLFTEIEEFQKRIFKNISESGLLEEIITKSRHGCRYTIDQITRVELKPFLSSGGGFSIGIKLNGPQKDSIAPISPKMRKIDKKFGDAHKKMWEGFTSEELNKIGFFFITLLHERYQYGYSTSISGDTTICSAYKSAISGNLKMIITSFGTIEINKK